MPEGGDAERLVVLLEARVRDFERNMKKAEGTADGSYRRMRQGSRSATRQMEEDMVRSTSRINQALAMTSTKIGAFGKAFGAGLIAPVAGLLSVTAALNGAKQALSEFDSIGKSAKAAGLTAEQFQELAYAANLGGVATDQFAKSLETLNRNAGLAAVGKGDLVEKLKALNPELLKSILAATSQAERMRIAADAIDGAGSASEKAALATTLFGESGSRMVEVLKGGSAALDNTAQKARALGVVISGDLIARAESLNDELSTATRIMDLQFKAVLVDLAPLLISTAELAGGLAIAIRQVVDAFKDMEDRSTATLRERLETVKALIAEGTGPMAGYTTDDTGNIVPTNPMAVTMGGGDVEALQAEQAAIEAILEARKSIANLPPIDLGGDSGGAAAVTDAMKSRLEALRESLMTEEELELNSHAKRLAEIQSFYEKGAILKSEHDSLIEAAHQQHADKMTDISRKQAEEEARIRDQTIGGVASLFGSLSALVEKTGGENLAAVKAFGVAEAVVNTAQGITKALTLPPPASWAQAAAVGAAGAAQIATIMSASKGSSSKPAVGGTEAASAATSQVQRTVNVSIQGDYLPKEGVGSLLQRIQDEAGIDGMKLVLVHKQA